MNYGRICICSTCIVEIIDANSSKASERKGTHWLDCRRSARLFPVFVRFLLFFTTGIDTLENCRCIRRGVAKSEGTRCPRGGAPCTSKRIIWWSLAGGCAWRKNAMEPAHAVVVGIDEDEHSKAFCIYTRVEKFTINHVNKSGAVSDATKLKWMNGQHLCSLPAELLIKDFEDQWRSTYILFAKEATELLKEGIDLVTDEDAALCNLLSYPLHDTLNSDEAKSVVEDKLSDVASGLISAYDSGELGEALAEGHDGWKKWVKSFGKTHKRKGKSLFMPLRVMLTGKLHGPAMDSTIILVHKAGTSGAVAPQFGFVSPGERFKIPREVNWESLQKQAESQGTLPCPRL